MDKEGFDAQGSLALAAVTGAASGIAGAIAQSAVPAIGADGAFTLALVGFAAGFAGYSLGYARGRRSASDGGDESAVKRSRRAIRAFSRSKASAVLAAYDAGGKIPPGKWEDEIIASVASGEGIFEAVAIGYGAPQVIESFGITDRWREFLNRSGNLAELRRVAGK